MTRLNDGLTHIILFSKGKLYLDGIQIAGSGMEPDNDVVFQLQVPKEEPRDSSILEINVVDVVAGKDIGPGQK